jgi:hypothetical protein
VRLGNRTYIRRGTSSRDSRGISVHPSNRKLMRYSIPITLSLLFASSTAPAQSPHEVWRADYSSSQSNSSREGLAVAIVGDLNNDGFSDVASGAHGVFNPQAQQRTGAVIVRSGRDGAELLRVYGDSGSVLFGSAITGVGDLTGDGVSDFVVGDNQRSMFYQNTGIVFLVSGADGSFVKTWFGSMHDGWGRSLAAIDLNFDGYKDIVVGGDNQAFVIDGRSRSRLFYLARPSQNQVYLDVKGFGASVSILDDLNGDLVNDIAVGAPETDGFLGSPRSIGAVFIFSGKTGQLLHFSEGMVSNEGLGRSVAPSVDVNGDNVPDYIAGRPGLSKSGQAVIAFSGKDSSKIFELKPIGNESQFGSRVARVGDMDGDGKADFCICAEGGVFQPAGLGTYRVIGSVSRQTILQGPSYSWFGQGLHSGEDVSGDGVQDFVVSGGSGTTMTRVHVISSRPLALSGDISEVSAGSAPSSQALHLDAGPSRAQDVYIVIGGVSGSKPGLPLGPSLTLPLNLDWYTDFCFAGGGTAFTLRNGVGSLSSSGQATAVFVAGGLFAPYLIGRTVEHCFVTLDSSGISSISNAYPVRVAP